jgi:outer membrane protein assembly factor BamB
MKHVSDAGKATGILAATAILALAGLSGAVTSKITRQTTDKELREGKSEGVVVMSPGTIQLGRAAKVLAGEFEGVWSVNSVVVSGGTAYIGTSPNGAVYQYRLGTLTKLYATDPNAPAKPSAGTGDAVSSRKRVKAASSEDEDDEDDLVSDSEQFANEHIFAMAVDVAGRLLVGFSGKHCRLCRYESGRMQTLFEPNDAKYIFAIETGPDGNIYLGTGPHGKVYSIDPSGRVVLPIYEAKDKNVLSLRMGRDGFLYAGVDGRGLVYKINLRTKTATVAYDSEEPEITGLAFQGGNSADSGNLYAAATAAKTAQAEREFASSQPSGSSPASGRPEPKEKSDSNVSSGDGDVKLQIPHSKKEPESKSSSRSRPPTPASRTPTASHLYKITKDGYVTEVFSESAFFLSLTSQNGTILAGTGNDGQLFAIDPDTERATVLYKDDKAAQITAVTVSGREIYVGTGNPARLILLSADYASEGTYASDLIDAGQPANWGKLQIDADIPKGCRVLVSARSGNVKDVNDPSYSPWTEPVEVTQPVPLTCPIGRFCQYKLILRTQDPGKTPVIREVALASTVPNLAPKVESVDVTRLTAANKEGFFKIAIKANDENEDKLTYRIDFRRIGRDRWIELKDKLEEETYEWDGRTVEDGRYELRITAGDERSNSPSTKLTGSRISDPVIVDNTGPAIRKWNLKKEPETSPKQVRLTLEAADELSILGKLEYTVDSNAEWKSTLPDDGAFDTTDENFTIVTDEIKPGDHVIAVKITDDAGNVTRKTFEFNL